MSKKQNIAQQINRKKKKGKKVKIHFVNNIFDAHLRKTVGGQRPF